MTAILAWIEGKVAGWSRFVALPIFAAIGWIIGIVAVYFIVSGTYWLWSLAG